MKQTKIKSAGGYDLVKEEYDNGVQFVIYQGEDAIAFFDDEATAIHEFDLLVGQAEVFANDNK